MNIVIQCGQNGEKVNIEQIPEALRQMAIAEICRGMKRIGFIQIPNSNEKTA